MRGSCRQYVLFGGNLAVVPDRTNRLAALPVGVATYLGAVNHQSSALPPLVVAMTTQISSSKPGTSK